jgi:glycosyltransferase involved in cell wall biosynthesis
LAAPAISVIVPAYESAATLGRALAAIADQELDEDFEVIVVDDGSADGTAAIAEQAGVRVLRQQHEGPGPARSRGAAEARAERLAFTDADCFPSGGWLAAGLAALEGADLVQGAVEPDPEASLRPLDRSVWVERETGLYESANLFVRRDLFERLGGFEDWLGPVIGKPLAEDVWLGWRARRDGARTAFAPDAVVHHAVFPRTLGEFVADRRRLVYFPRIAAKVPELRSGFFARCFLNRRSAAFDLGLAGAAAALATGSPLALLACAPYGTLLGGAALRWRRHAPLAALGGLLGDAVGFGALAWGSLRARSLLL